ncbi:MAG: HEAT repeat domain-containing protein [Cyanobacteria bacterium J06632_3]
MVRSTPNDPLNSQNNNSASDRDATKNPAGNLSLPDSLEAQSQVDQLLDQVNQQIEMLAFDNPAPGLLRQMVQSLTDPRRATRIRLIETLSQIGEVATPYLLEGVGQHSEAVVRRACCNALTNIGDATSIPGLITALLQDDDIGVKSAAAGALAKVGAPAFDAIREVLASEEASESCKGHAAWALASMGSEVSDQLYRTMSDPSPTVRTAVVGAIAQLAQKQLAQKQLSQKQLGHKDPNQKQLAAPSASVASGATSKVSGTLTMLTEALSDQSPEVRIEAAANLARLNCQKAYQPLIACLKDTDSSVRKAAVLALAKLGRVEAIEAISPLTQDLDSDVRRVADLAIAQLDAKKEMA